MLAPRWLARSAARQGDSDGRAMLERKLNIPLKQVRSSPSFKSVFIRLQAACFGGCPIRT